jgi:SAM-dependent methyltransferase
MIHHCRICGHAGHKEIFSHPETPLFVGIIGDKTPTNLENVKLPISLLLCESCLTVQQASNAKVDALLDQIYLISQDNACSGTRTGEGEFGMQRANEFIEKTGLSTMPKRVLEIGCNEGHMLEVCERLGAESLCGIEPSVKSETRLSDKITILPGYFDGQSFPAGSFDLVFLISVFEHIPDAAEFLGNIRDVMAPGGQLALSVPNCESGLEYGNLGMPIHEHLLYFTSSSLKNVLSRCGFKVVKQEATFANLYCVAEKVDGVLEDNQAEPVRAEKFWPACETRIDITKKFAQMHQKRWGLYGACSLTANLLAWSSGIDLTNACLADADPNKWGKLVSGCELVTTKPSQAVADGVTDFMVMPFGFQEGIREHINRDYPSMEPVLLFENIAAQYATMRALNV